MAVAVQLDFKDGTLEQYDRVIDVMGFTPGGPGAPGGLFHWVARTDDGIRIVDVWQDRETFDRFAEGASDRPWPRPESTSSPRSPSTRCTTT